jgi:hypothetical protein
MATNYDSRAKTKATATIQAELERIDRNFDRSLRLCNEAAELLMMGAGQELNDIRHSKLKQTCSLFRDVPTEVNRAIRART